ncbi:MAG: hypothetical protein GEV09_09330 [Pseudonocardiaceae bacterium]|nr:hypothetical protein [Pseudonocardiaceae bacterium]
MTAPTQPWAPGLPGGRCGPGRPQSTGRTDRYRRSPGTRPGPVRPAGIAPSARLSRRGEVAACSAERARDRATALVVVALVTFAVAFGLVLLGQVVSEVPGGTSAVEVDLVPGSAVEHGDPLRVPARR